VTGFLRDLRAGLKRLLGQPVVTAIAVLSLALGLAFAASLTSLLDAFGFRPLAIAQPDQLVMIQMPSREDTRGSVTWNDVVDIRTVDAAFESVAGSMTKGVALTGGRQAPEVVWLSVVTSNYFRVLGVRPFAGRDLAKADDDPGAPPVVVLSYRLWSRKFGASTDAIGRTMELNGATCTIVGVAPPEFSGIDLFNTPDVWVPSATWPQLFPGSRTPPSLTGSSDRAWAVVARRRPDVTIAQADAAVQTLLPRLLARLPATAPATKLVAADLQRTRLGGLTTIRTIVWTLVGLVVLVGCANVAGLLLGQAEARQRELVIRTALGAGRGRLIRMLVAESLVLAALSGVAGLALGWWLIGALPSLIPPFPIPFGFQFRFDLRVLVMTFSVAVGTVLAFGLWPAFRAARRDLAPRLGRSSATPSSGLRWLSAQNVLVAVQVAVSSALLICGGLLLRGIDRSQQVSAGFERRPMLMATLVPGILGHGAAETRMFLRDLLDRIHTTPGVAAAALARTVPLSLLSGGATREIEIADRPETSTLPLKLKYNAVSAGYFDTMGTRILRGRPITRDDTPSAPKVAVINRTLAQQFWPDDSAVGRNLRIRGWGDADIVGVAEDGKYNRLSETPQPFVFFAAEQMSAGEITLIVRASSDTAALAPAVRSVLHDLDPAMPVLQMMTLDEHLRLSTFDLQISELVISVLGGAGFVLSVIGLYGVIALLVARRTREFGIRLALGAAPRQVERSVARHAATLALAGLALGCPLALAGASALGDSLYGLSPADPATYAAVSTLVFGVSLLAAWAPARRAMHTDPAVVLKQE
jgi:predicted permease